MNLVYVVLSLFGVSYIYRYKIYNAHQPNQNEPLILTNYLNQGQAEIARKLSAVQPFVGNIKSHSGYFRVSDDCERNMFFWYFPAQNGNTAAPLIVWLQGGPGASSLFGLFVENGPYYFDSENNMNLRNKSWTEEYSVLYIDNPVGAGFSFSDQECYLTNQDQVGLYLSRFMLQFYQLFPNLKANPLYITGESYAGKYVPAMTYAIHQMNQNNPTPINLVGMAIGDGLSDPYNMMDFGAYLNKIGLIFDNQVPKFDHYHQLIRQSIEAEEYEKASEYFDLTFDLFYNLTGLTNYYDYYANGQPSYMGFINFVTKNSALLHAGNTTFHNLSYSVYDALYADISKTVAPKVTEIINAGYKTLFFSGQFDVIVPYPMTSSFLKQLEWNGKEEFVNAPQQIWYSSTGPKKVNGYLRSAGNVKQLVIRNAGHMVPMDQPAAGLEMLRNFVYDLPF